MTDAPLITHPAAVLGLLLILLGLVFHTTQSPHPFWQRFYRYVPALLLCYLLPALMNTLGIVDGTGTPLYRVAIDYLLPPTLALLTLSVDLPGIRRLGGKAIAMFLAGTFGIVIGGPIAILAFRALSPETVAGDTWTGMATLAGSWIGGGANQAAMKAVFDVDADLFGGSYQFTAREGERTWGVTLSDGISMSDSNGIGPSVTRASDGTVLRAEDFYNDGYGGGTSIRGNYGSPMLGGKVDLTARYGINDWHSVTRLTAPGSRRESRYDNDGSSGEFGVV